MLDYIQNEDETFFRVLTDIWGASCGDKEVIYAMNVSLYIKIVWGIMTWEVIYAHASRIFMQISLKKRI